jgi:hypothetical protein
MPIEARALAAHVPDAVLATPPPPTLRFRVLVEHIVSALTIDDALAVARQSQGTVIAVARLD